MSEEWGLGERSSGDMGDVEVLGLKSKTEMEWCRSDIGSYQ